ncbi:MAG: glycoside hydrolase family 172 protein [Caldivirga sp.]
MLLDLPRLKPGKLRYISSTHYIDEEHRKWLDYYSVPAHGKLTLLDVSSPGVIASLWLTVAGGFSKPAVKDYLRRLIIRAYWDGESSPSIEAPLSCFFGSCYSTNTITEYHHYSSLVMGTTSGGFYTFLPMPFKRAIIEVENCSDLDVDHLYYMIGYYEGVDVSSMGRLHAVWRSENPTELGKPYLILEALGQGHYVGTVLAMEGLSQANPPSGGLGFLEGNMMIYADGELAYGSTGTEDYFLSGWYFIKGPFNAPFHGLVIKDEERFRILAYRFHIPDSIPFQRELRVMIHHGEYDEVLARYESVAYWYQVEPHSEFNRIDCSRLS